ncbi:MAG: hypothetical protein AB7V18_19420 [Pyrinomonadaceae bacterium]
MTQMNINASPIGRHMKLAKKAAKRGYTLTPMEKSGQPIGGGSGTGSLPNNPNSIISDIYNSSPQAQITKKKASDPVQLFIDAMNNANMANEDRYKQSIGLLAGQGQSSKLEARRQSQEGFAGDTQSLISRGLGNTTVLDSARRRRDEDYQRAAQSIDESVADRVSGVVERRTDQAPNYGAFTDLLREQAMSEAQNKAQSKKTKSLIIGPKGSGGGAGGSGGGGGNSYSGGGGGSSAQGVQTYTNPNASQSFWGTAGINSGNATVGMPAPHGVTVFGYADPNRTSAMRSKKKK